MLSSCLIIWYFNHTPTNLTRLDFGAKMKISNTDRI